MKTVCTKKAHQFSINNILKKFIELGFAKMVYHSRCHNGWYSYASIIKWWSFQPISKKAYGGNLNDLYDENVCDSENCVCVWTMGVSSDFGLPYIYIGEYNIFFELCQDHVYLL